MKYPILKAVVAGLGLMVSLNAASAAEDGAGVGEEHWTFGGIRGHFDRPQLQRGFQVYKEVCSTCHGVKRLSFRNLSEKGGPQFPEEGVKGLAATYKVNDGPNDQGKMFKRPGRASDRIPPPFDNDQQARSANNGALPPDLSLMARARSAEAEKPFYLVPWSMLRDIFISGGYQEGGADYIHALLTGYQEKASAYRNDNGHLVMVSEAEAGNLPRCASVTKGDPGQPDVCNKMADGMSYNTTFPGHQIAMPPPLRDGVVKYGDGTPATMDNYSRDVTAFLAWAADPKLEERKRLGMMTMAYLLITALLLYLAKRRVWEGEAH